MADDTTMTVGQIIERLKQYPPDLEARFVYDSGCDRLILDECFAIKWIGGRRGPPIRQLLLNVHPGQYWGGHDTEQEQIDYVRRR